MKRIFPAVSVLAMILILILCGEPVSAQPTDNARSVSITTILNNYTFPSGISTDGAFVVGSYFGSGASYFWSAASGSVTSIAETAYGVSDNGLTAGTFTNPNVLYNGSSVETAGIFDPATGQWTFLGMNPASTLFSTDYNTGWDISADGLTVVGMQWFPGYDVSAFSWTQSGGYQMIGNGVGQGSRASGISANGLVVFGWGETTVSRTPVIWYNNQVIFLNSNQPGEAFGASTTGNYVTGTLGGQAFRWSPQETVYFANTLNAGSINPVAVTNNGTVFGYTDTSWPPNPLERRAFARDSAGVLMTFNDYAEARGLTNAQQWIFYSVNDATADGNTVVGSGKNPSGQNTTFIMEFAEEVPVAGSVPNNLDFGEVQTGDVSAYQEVKIFNAGGGNLQVSGTSLGGTHAAQFLLQDNNQYPVTLAYGDSITVSAAFAPASSGPKTATLDISAIGSSLSVPLSGIGKIAVGMEEHRQDRLTAWPNPAGTAVSLRFPDHAERVRIFNAMGAIVTDRAVKGQKTMQLDVSGYPAGIYKIRCDMAGGVLQAVTLVVRHHSER